MTFAALVLWMQVAFNGQDGDVFAEDDAMLLATKSHAQGLPWFLTMTILFESKDVGNKNW